MKRSISFSTLFLLVGALFVAPGVAQDRDVVASAAGSLYVVSAKAGGVSYVEGGVTVDRANGGSGPLVRGDFVEIGDNVTTGDSGRAEVMMNPGSFIRLDAGSEFQFETTSLDDLKVNLSKGTAIFEVFASDDFKVRVNTREYSIDLTKSGVYRLDVDSAGQARLEVWKGRAEAVSPNDVTIKKGRAASIEDGSVAVAKFDRDMDEFEEWSKSRAKAIAKANRKLSARRLGPTVLNSYRDYSWNCYDSLGLWVFNRQLATYSFLPFGYAWRSPYGFRLRSNTSICNYPSYYWRPIIPYGTGGSGGDGGSGGNGGTGGGGGTRGNDEPPIRNPRSRIDGGVDRRSTSPPFRTLERTRSVPRSRPIGPVFGPRGFPSTRRTGGGSTKTTTAQPAKPRDTKQKPN